MAILCCPFPRNDKSIVERSIIVVSDIGPSDEFVKGGHGFGPHLLSCRTLNVVKISSTIASDICATCWGFVLGNVEFETNVRVEHHHWIGAIVSSP